MCDVLLGGVELAGEASMCDVLLGGVSDANTAQENSTSSTNSSESSKRSPELLVTRAQSSVAGAAKAG